MTRVVALVPMRHSSERVPGKNYRDLAGRPLYAHIISTLLSSGVVDQVVVDTDSPTVTEGMATAFPEVLVLERPEHLRAGEVPMNDVILHDISQVEADLYLQTHTTNPLLRPETVKAAVEAFLASPGHDSLFTVTALHTRLWTQDGKPMNHDPKVLLRTQDLPPVYEENSNMYLFTADLIRGTGSRIGNSPMLYPVDAEEAWDIDVELDWLVVEALLARRA
jgi:CMP-N-acetylneuraminic acid synthetase